MLDLTVIIDGEFHDEEVRDTLEYIEGESVFIHVVRDSRLVGVAAAGERNM